MPAHATVSVRMSDWKQIKKMIEFVAWTLDTRDGEGIPATYEEIHDRAAVVLEALREGR